eukprot:CAMPEP_0183780836 /NCGR_PEP_ID=MMETSP0739-20130205/57297_1 /TAXON_ID=385413 /ORGANISM="Thalassiosira miniscula, Strain CCMP1093" /LENGTH=195 /DNA_ID=CAMNT_0026023879 /DNA_START=63 /DNA_END=646 /DNA_ORIENTATION=+
MLSSLVSPNSCMPNTTLEIIRILLQKFSSLLSLLGSSHILSCIHHKFKTMPKHSIDPYQRIMLGYAGFDVLYGFFYWFMGTWLTPRETGWWGAVGNGKTCEMQGFFFYFWYGSAVYQMTLSLQMLLLVVYMWTPVQFEQLLERKLHAFNIISTLFLATLPLFFDGYNPECGTCRLVPAPAWCGDWVLADRYALHA